MGSTHQPRKIGVWGHYHGANHGDECVVAALIEQIRRRCPEAQLYGFSQKPADTEARHGIPSFPIRRTPRAPRNGNGASPSAENRSGENWRQVRKELLTGGPDKMAPVKDGLRRHAPLLFRMLRAVRRTQRMAVEVIRETGRLAKSWWRLRGFDMLIVAGSGPVTDGWDGPWSHPYSIFRWALLSRLTGTQFVFLSVGGGPLKIPLAQFFVRWSMRWASYRSFRDPSSAALIESIGVRDGNLVFPDLGFSLELDAPQSKPRIGASGRPIVGLNPMAHEDPRYMPRGDVKRYIAYIAKLADVSEWLLREGYEVVVFYSDIEADPKACADLRALLEQRVDLPLADCWHEEEVQTFDDMVDRIGRCDLLISARYHCMIVPILLGRPVLALAYHPKTFDLMESMGQSRYCLDIDQFSANQLIERFREMEERRDAIRRELADRVARSRELLDEQYTNLLGPLPDSSPDGHDVCVSGNERVQPEKLCQPAWNP